MKVYIYEHRNNDCLTFDVQPNQRQVITERIDMGVLDGREFSFICNYGENIPPYSIIEINRKYMFISSVCNKNIAYDGAYIHNATVIDPIKLFECFILGSKAFSNVYDDSISEVPDYNSNYRRCEIILELIQQQYCEVDGFIKFTNMKLELDNVTFSQLQEEREYSFGSGTTMYDALNEIVSTENCILKGDIIEDGNTFKVIAKAMNLESYRRENEYELTHNETLVKEANVDEYCYSVETEIDNVVDRNRYQIWNGTPRSNEDIITMDNCNLVLDSKIYYPKYMKTEMLSANCAVFRFERDYSLLPINKTYDAVVDGFWLYNNGSSASSKIGYMSYGRIDINVFRNKYVPSDLRDAFGYWFNSSIQSLSTNQYRTLVYFTPKWVYCLVTLPDNNADGYEGVVNFPHMVTWNPLLEENEYNLIEARYKQYFLSYKHLGNTIDNFQDNYTSYNSNWLPVNILESFKKFNTEESVMVYKGEYFFCDFEEHSGNKNTYNNVSLNHGCLYNTNMNYPVVINANKITVSADSFLQTKFQVKYISADSMMLRNYKSNSVDLPKNEHNWKFLSRSYNNGGNNADYKALTSDMLREVEALGRTYTSFESTEYYFLGAYIKGAGYVVVRQTTMYQSGAIKYNYQCYPKLNATAKDISIETQFEATNVPNQGVIDRYIYAEEHYAIIDTNLLNNKITNPMLIIFGEGNNGYSNLGKYASVYKDGDHYLVTASMIDNYTLGYRQGFDSENQYGNKSKIPVPIKNNEFNGSFAKSLTWGYFNSNQVPDGTQMKVLPLTNWGSLDTEPIVKFTKNIYKDPRERLIFVFKTIDWETI